MKPFARAVAAVSPTTSSTSQSEAAREPSSVATFLTGMRVEGPISAREDIHVDTDVNGPITSDSKVTVGPKATIHGEIKAREIVIMGRVIGNVDATEKVALCDGADLRGDITTFRISMEETAYFVGKIDCRPSSQARAFPPGSSTESRGRNAPEKIRPSLSA